MSEELRQKFIALIVEWRQRQLDYEQEWRDAAKLGKKGDADRLAAADISAEVRICIRQIEEILATD